MARRIKQDVVDSIAQKAGLSKKDASAGLNLTPEQEERVTIATREVHENGYAIFPRFLEPDRLARVREGMEPIFEMSGSRKAKTKTGRMGVQTVHVHNLFAKTRATDELAVDPMLLTIIDGVLGPLFQISIATAMCPDPGVDPQGLHQDDGAFTFPRPHFPLVANTLIALDDFTRENGATMVVPGSHKWNKAVEQNAEVVYAEMPAGSVLVWDGALWHAGGGNTTRDQRRRSINLNYNLSWLRQQENQYLGIPRDVLLSLSERLQRLLGYDYSSYCGGVDYQDSLEYLKKLEA